MPDLLPAGRTRGVLTTAVILVCAVTVASCSSSSDAPASTTVTPVADAPASTTVPGDATGSAESPSGPAAAASTDESSSAASDGDAVAAALATLDTLAVKGRAPKTGYDRDLFGQAWADVDRNGCDTRIIYSSQQGCLPTVLFRVHFSENSQGMSDRGTFATRSGMQA